MADGRQGQTPVPPRAVGTNGGPPPRRGRRRLPTPGQRRFASPRRFKETPKTLNAHETANPSLKTMRQRLSQVFQVPADLDYVESFQALSKVNLEIRRYGPT